MSRQAKSHGHRAGRLRPVLALQNTLTRRVEPLRPLHPAIVDDVQLRTHRLPARAPRQPPLLPPGDLVRRALAWQGLTVRQVMNITDVGHMTDELRDRGEDKMQLAAEDEGLTAGEIAAKYEAAFHHDCARLGFLPADVYPRASDHVPQMIDLIERLLDRGHAYVDAGTVYYDVATFPDYGALSRNRSSILRAGHRLDAVDHHKRNPPTSSSGRRPGTRRVVQFDSPWGVGYPGWHIECSAMSLELPRRALRRPYRGRRPDLPPPRGRDRPERGRARTSGRDPLGPRRPPPVLRPEDGEVGGQRVDARHRRGAGRRPGSTSATCASPAATGASCASRPMR